MTHSSWAGRNGAPQGIQALAQTPDGLLWIGSLQGLTSFDGISFRPLNQTGDPESPASRPIHFLLVDRSGALWAFGYHGPAMRVAEGQVTTFGQTDGASLDVLSCPQKSSKGEISAVLNERQLVHLGADSVWHTSPDPQNGSGHITFLAIDSQDTAWLVVNDQLFRRPDHTDTFQPTEIYMYGRTGFVEDAAHTLWLTSEGPGTASHPAFHLQRVDQSGHRLASPEVDVPLVAALPAPDSSLWLLTLNNQIVHLGRSHLSTQGHFSLKKAADHRQLDVATQGEGSHAFIRASDNALWSGGTGGLERFSDPTLVPLWANAAVGNWESCMDAVSALWVKDPQGALYRGSEGSVERMSERNVGDLFCSPDGHLLAADTVGLLLLDGNHPRLLPPLPGLTGYLNHYVFTGALHSRDGRIYAAVAGGSLGRSLWVFANTGWHRLLTDRALPEISALSQDTSGRILLGFRDANLVGVLTERGLQLQREDAPGLHSIFGFANTSYGLFAYGINGIALRSGDHMHNLLFLRPELATNVTGLAESRNGTLWINATHGIVRIPAEEVRSALADPTHRLVSNNLQEGDFVGPSYPGLFSDTVHADQQGRLWFTTLNGMVSVDPTQVQPSPAPRLSLRTMLADGRPLSPTHTFPANVGMLRIGYIGVDLANPNGVSYRYKLDGYDSDWQDAGSRTEAIYTHLHHGHYRFSVLARNSFGIWSDPVLSEPFSVLPHFYQEAWFQALCACISILLVWGILRARLAATSASIQQIAEERADERIRISRDLHDTLLQGVQGLLLSFHAAAERVPPSHPSRPALEHALVTAEKIVLEGRDRVKGLRTSDLADKDLALALEDIGNDLNTSGSVDFIVQCPPSPRVLREDVLSEIFLIAREAIINAFRHARARSILVRVHHGKQKFHLTCTDDGQGFDPTSQNAVTERNHWGICGMTERAHKLRAHLDLRSAPGQGTTVRITVDARRAYR